MKPILYFLALLLFTLDAFGQAPSNPTLAKEYYLQKSKNQKTTAWVLLVGGTAMLIGGGTTFNSSWDSGSDAETDVAGFITIGGIIADIVSIPYFISSSRNKKRAAAITVNRQPIYLPLSNGIALKTQPAITMKVTF